MIAYLATGLGLIFVPWVLAFLISMIVEGYGILWNFEPDTWFDGTNYDAELKRDRLHQTDAPSWFYWFSRSALTFVPILAAIDLSLTGLWRGLHRLLPQ